MFSADTTFRSTETESGHDSDIHLKAANHILNSFKHEGCLSEIDYLMYKKKLNNNLQFDEINCLMNSILLNCGQITVLTDWYSNYKLVRHYNKSDQLIMERQEEAKLLTPTDFKMSLSPINFKELFPKSGAYSQNSNAIKLKINSLTIKLNWLIVNGILGKEDAYVYINKITMIKNEDDIDDRLVKIAQEIFSDCGQDDFAADCYSYDSYPKTDVSYLLPKTNFGVFFLMNAAGDNHRSYHSHDLSITKMPTLHDYQFYKSSFPFFSLKSKINKGSDNIFPPAIVNIICDYLITYHMMNLAKKQKNYCGLEQGYLLKSGDSKKNYKEKQQEQYTRSFTIKYN